MHKLTNWRWAITAFILIFIALIPRGSQSQSRIGTPSQNDYARLIRVQPAPTVGRKDLTEAACVAFVASKLGLRLSIEEIITALPLQTTRPDIGFVRDWGFELKALPDVCAEFGMEAQYRPGLSPGEAAELIRSGCYVMYRTQFEAAGAERTLPRAPIPVARAVRNYSSQMIQTLITTVILSVDATSVRLYDPYKGIVTLPSALVGEGKAGRYHQGSFGYSFNLWMRPRYEAVVISPQLSERPPKPLLTTTWSQGDPYNSLCPAFEGFGQKDKKVPAAAGCVPIAMAQVMAYHNWPTRGVGEHTDTLAFGGGLQGQGAAGAGLSSNFAEHEYDWQKVFAGDPKAVGRLVLDCGIATDAAYYMGSTTVNTAPLTVGKSDPDAIGGALMTYFRYKPGIKVLKRESFPNSAEWFNHIKEEIDAGRPILYLMWTKKGAGHTVVLDGYRVKGNQTLVHLNFGWGGPGNRYYPVDDITDDVTGYNWNAKVRAIVGISPAKSQ